MTLRVLMVAAERRTSGGEVVFHHLARGLAGRPGIRIDVLVPTGAELAGRIGEDPGCARIRVFTSPLLRRLGEVGPGPWGASLVDGSREILGLVRRERHDVVLFGALGASAYGLPLWALERCRLVAIHHNLRSSRAEAAYGRWLFKGHAMVCVSQAVARAVRTPVNRSRIHVIPNGVPLGRPPDPGKLLGPGPLRLLMAGRITRWKGLHVLLDALAAMRDGDDAAHPVVRVEVAGRPWTGPEREYEAELRRSVVERGLSDIVSFVGHVPLELRMDRAHCLVHAAVQPEPFGMVVAEAMARACLVVAADAGGIPELVRHGETGYLYRPGDAFGLARRLEWLVRHRAHPEVRQIAARARRRVEEEFSLERQVDAYARLLTGGSSSSQNGRK